MRIDSRSAKTHVLTVSLEDYFHVAAFRGSVSRKHWDRLESRLGRSVPKVLDLLDKGGVKATFFVSGYVAESNPWVVGAITNRGHEIASAGYWPSGPRTRDPKEFKEELRRAKKSLESLGANRILGYRSPRNWLKSTDLWMVDALAEEGYAYDSSMNPVLRRFQGEPWQREVHRHRNKDGQETGLMEIPISTASFFGLRYAISGGNYIRQLPHTLLRPQVDHWSRTKDSPVVFYFMPWELDPDQPHIQLTSRLNQIRHYRNLEKTRWVLEDYLKHYKFQPVHEYLKLKLEPGLAGSAKASALSISTEVDPGSPDLPGVTLVVPIYNEEQGINYLFRTLMEFRRRLNQRYRVSLCLVDDGSDDGSYDKLREFFDHVPACRIVKHERNQGVAAAIMTGIRAAETDVVCSIDCDCSYDPVVLEAMIPLLGDADLVTASPYHPKGGVMNVPSWRLFLSRTLCRMYSFLLGDRIFTYTSCCRVYKKSSFLDLSIKNTGFLGVAEMLVRLKLNGGTVVEHPATLESRLLGESKMKIFRTIVLHLRFLGELVRDREGLRRARSRSSKTGPTVLAAAAEK